VKAHTTTASTRASIAGYLSAEAEQEEGFMFLAIAGVLFLIWLLGEIFTHGASLAIHILAIVWVISLIGGLFSSKK